jgi:flavorubredoxin
MELAELGVKDVKVFDVSKTNHSYLLAAAFEYSTLVFASATYNAEIFDHMHTFLTDVKNHNLSGRKVGLIENGSWASMAAKKMTEILGTMKDMTILEPSVKLMSSVDDASAAQIKELAKVLADTVS